MKTIVHPARAFAQATIAELDAVEASERMQPEHDHLRAALVSLSASPGDRTRVEHVEKIFANYVHQADLHYVMPREDRAKHLADSTAVVPGAFHPVTKEAIPDEPKRRAAGAALAAADSAFIARVTAK